MAVANKTLRNRMLLTTAVAALMATMPSAAHAQLVTSGDLSSAVDSAGNPGQLTVTDTNATTTDIEVEAAVVVAEWTDFNVDLGDTVNVTIDPGLAIAEATLFNRVIGGNPSNINGTINAANINFWLVNQNGILFGNDTSITAQSFFASTIDVANQDIFDFYEGTDVFGNGTNLLNFAGPSTNAVQSLGNATFITDGSLMFAGQQLDLTGSFDAQSGRAIYVAASDVDVSFTPGSPLVYTVNAGTTIASQSIDGTVQGASAEFAMFTDVGVVGALLDIDASVTATTALATDRGITLLASGPSSVTVEIGGAFSSTGEVVLDSNGAFTATANITGSDLDVDATGAISALDLTSTDGNVNINAGTTITAGAVDTSGVGGATLTAGGNITTASITSNEPGVVNGFIDVESTGGGTLDLGTLSSDGNIDLDTSGLVTANTISSLGDLTIGGTTTPTTVTFTGNVSADAIDIDATGLVTAQDIESTNGDVNILADAIAAGSVTSTEGDVVLSATNNITTTSITSNESFGSGGAIDIDSTGGGTLDLGAVSGDGAANLDTTGTLTLGLVNIGGALVIGATNQPTTLNLNDSITAGSFAFTSANPFVSQDITTTDGDLNIDASSISTGNLEADNGGGVILTASGNITTASITSNEPGVLNGFIDVESTGGGTLDLGTLSSDGNIDLDTSGLVTANTISSLGDLTIGGTTTPTTVTFTGNVSADAIDIDATGLVTAQDIESTNGDVNILADAIAAGSVTSTEGDVVLSATNNITTTSITSNESFGSGGAIDIDSTGGGTLDLGAVSGDGAANLDTTGTLTLGLVNIGGALVIGATNQPTTLNLNDSITAGSFAFTSANPFVSQDITTTDGDLNIDASSISTGNLEADNGGGVILTASGNITTASITSNEPGVLNGFIDVESTGGGTLDLGTLSSDGNIDLDTSGLVTANTISSLGDLTIGGTTTPTTVTFTGNVSADAIDIDATGLVTAQDIESTNGDVNILADAIAAGSVTSTEGDVVLSATNNITTTSITSNESFGSGGAIDIDSTGGGTLDLGAVSGDGAANLDTTGTLTLGLVNIGGALVIGATNQPTTLNLNDSITAGSFAFTSANPFVSQDITTTDGDLNIDASSISTGNLEADNGGGVILTASGNITTASITSNEPGVLNGFIDVESTGGGTLDLGTLSSDGNIDLDTSGLVTANTISSLGDLTIGGTTTPTTVTFTGNVSADAIDIDATGLVTAQDIESTNGDVNILADAIAAGSVTSTEGDVVLSATNNITTTSITSNESFGSGGAIDIDSTGGGTLDLGAVSGDGAANLDTTGTLTLGLVNIGGALVIGATNQPTTLNLNDSITAGSFAFTSANPFVSQDITTTDGDLNIDASSISTGNLEADNGGGVILTASGNITTASITSNEPGVLNGFIDVESTGGGTLDLGTLSSDGNIDLDTSGLVTANTISSLGDLTIGGTTTPTTVTFTGNVSADAIDIDATGLVTAQDIESTNGDVNILADAIAAGSVTSTEGDVVLSATNNITTTSITSNESFGSGGAIDIDSTGGGTLDLGAVSADGTFSADTTASITAGDVVADLLAVNSGGAITFGNVTSNQSLTLASTGANLTTGDVVVNNAGGSATLRASGATGDVTSGALNTNGGDILVSAGRNITTGAVSTALAGAPTAGTIGLHAGGTINSGQVDAGEDLLIDGSGAVTLVGVSAGDDVVITSAGNVTSTGPISANGSGIDVFEVSFAGAPGASNLLFAAETRAGSNIDIDSTAGGTVDLADLTADAGIALDTTGALTADTVTAGGALLVGQTAMPSAITFTGNVAAASMDIDTVGALTANDMTANAGEIDVDAGSIAASALSATGNIELDAAGAVTISSAVAGGALLVGTTTPPSDLTIAGASSGASVTLQASGAITVDDITANTGSVLVDAMGGGLTAQAVVANGPGGSLTLRAGGATSDIAATTLNTNGGDILVSAGRNITTGAVSTALAGAPTAGTIGLHAGGTINSGQVDAGEDLLIDGAGAVTLVGVSAGDDVVITSAGNVTSTGPISANGSGIDVFEVSFAGAPGASNLLFAAETRAGSNIDIDSTAGGTVDLADLTADAGIALDTTGALTADTVTAGGALLVGQTAMPSAITFTGNVAAASMDIDAMAGATLQAQNLTANAGGIDIDAGSTNATNVNATGAIAIDGSGTVSLTSVAAGGDLSIGTSTSPAQLTVSGTASGANASLHAGTLDVATVTATAGDVDLTGSTLTVGTAQATNNVTADATNAITFGTVTANSDALGGGDVAIGVVTAPGQLTVGASASGVNVTLQADTMNIANAAATGGDATLTASGNITAGPITATAAGAVGGSIAVKSATTGNLSLGALNADAGIMLDAPGTVETLGINADTDANLAGDLIIGSMSNPTSVKIVGNADAAGVTINAGALEAQDITATNGNLLATIVGDITAGNLSVQNNANLQGGGEIKALDVTAGAIAISTTGGAITLDTVVSTAGATALTASGSIATDSITANGGSIDVESTGVGNLTLGMLTTDNGIALDTDGNVLTGTVTATNALQVGAASQIANVDFQGTVTAGSVNIDANGLVTGTAVAANNGDVTIGAINRPDQVTLTNVTGANVLVNSDGFDFAEVIAQSGDVTIAANVVGGLVGDTGAVTATGDVTIDANGEVQLRQISADSDNMGGGEIRVGTSIRPSLIKIARGLEGEAITLRSGGGGIAIGSNGTVYDIIASNGDVDIEVNGSADPDTSIRLQTRVSASGGDVRLASDGGILAQAPITAIAAAGVGGAIDIQSTGGGRISTGDLTADNGILIDTSNSISTGAIRANDDADNVGDFAIGSRIQSDVGVTLDDDVTAANIAINTSQGVQAEGLTATVGNIDIAALEIRAGDLSAPGAIVLDASDSIQITGLVADADRDGNGDLIVGQTTTPDQLIVGTGDAASIDFVDDGNSPASSFVGGDVTGASVTIASNGLVALGDVAATNGDTDISAGSNIRIGALDTTGFRLSAAEAVRTDGAVTGVGAGEIEARSLIINQAITAGGTGLIIRSGPDASILIGDADGDAEAQGDLILSDAELDLITTTNLTIDAGTSAIDIGNVTFADQTGSDTVTIINRGAGSLIEIEGNVSGTGAGRTFQIGVNDPGANDVTSRIVGKIEKSTIDLGAANLDLRATDIVFGSAQLIGELEAPAGNSAQAVTDNFVGNSGSTLFSPDAALIAARTGNEVFLRAGNLEVTYGETALFQNILPRAGAGAQFAGVVIGDEVTRSGSLTLRPTDDTNAFALFGTINELNGDAVAFAPEPVLVIDGQASVFGSRINGCLIRSGADCITTVVDTTIIQIPREVVSLLTADPGVFLPFDPLVGTNNEGLFSGAASGLVDDECQRDENGICR